MNKEIVSGVYPTMVTPFLEDYSIDEKSLDRLIQWYLERGVDGIFAVCQSSAMFELSLRERSQLGKKVVELVGGKCPVMISGHVSDNLEDQYAELMDMIDTGADALVLVSNRLASQEDSHDTWQKNLESLLNRLPTDIPLGFYECPYPYKRLITADQLNWMVKSQRFGFIKDTCCDPDTLRERAAICENSSVKLFDANAATLLFSLQQGYSGYSGIMANFHPDLYNALCHGWKDNPEGASALQDYLGLASIIETQLYPTNAKYLLMLEDVFETAICRRSDVRGKVLSASQKLEVEQFHRVSQLMSGRLQAMGTSQDEPS